MLWLLCAASLLSMALMAQGEVPGLGHPTPAKAAGSQIFITADGAYQFQGWGTNLAWWANVVGGWSSFGQQYIDSALFGPQEPNDPELPRLGLTVVRYNIGASPTDSSVLPAFCPSLRPGAAVPSPAQTPFPAGQFDPASLNLNADQRQIQILKQARDFIAQTGEQPTLEAFANSPPWWMNVNQCASGDSEPFRQENNLGDAYKDPYVRYLAAVVAAFRDQEGIDFGTVEPFNEPASFPWPGVGCRQSNTCQEGDNFDTGLQRDILHRLCAQGANAAVSAPDGNTVDETITDFQSYDADPAAKGCVMQINTHDYSASTKHNQLRITATSRGLWMSEYGNGGNPNTMDSALPLAKKIATDLRYLHPRAWVYWQPVEGPGKPATATSPPIPGGWGLFQADDFPNEGPSPPDFTKRFWALEHYSRFIRPNYTILTALDGLDDPSAETATSVAAIDPGATKVVIVTVNPTDAPRPVTYDLSLLHLISDTGSVRAWRTSNPTDGSHPNNLVPQDLAPMTGSTFSDAQDPSSINTYVVSLSTPGLPGTGQPPFNVPPTVSAGPDVAGDEGAAVPLSGSVGDPDDVPAVTWRWAPGRTSTPARSAASPTRMRPRPPSPVPTTAPSPPPLPPTTASTCRSATAPRSISPTCRRG